MQHLDAGLARAQSLFELRRFDDALAQVARVLVAASDDPRSHVLRARILRGAGRCQEALAATEAALALDPNRDETYRLGCALLIDLGRPADAWNAAQHAVRIDPKYAWNHYLLVQALIANGQLDAAAESATRVRALDPDAPLGWDAIGLVAAAREDWTTAEEVFRKALQFTPDDARRIHNLGTMLMHQGRASEATTHFIQGGRTHVTEPAFLQSTFRAAVVQLVFGRFLRAAVRLDDVERRSRSRRGKDTSENACLALALILQPVVTLLALNFVTHDPFLLLVGLVGVTVVVVGFRYRGLPPESKRALAIGLRERRRALLTRGRRRTQNKR